jgi:hypothetical protein
MFEEFSELPFLDTSQFDFNFPGLDENPFAGFDLGNFEPLEPINALGPLNPQLAENPFANLIRGLPGLGGNRGGGGGGGGANSLLNLLGGGARAIGSGLLGNGGLLGLLGNPSLIPSLVQGISGLRDADKYMDRANEYAEDADPFGKHRGFYGDRLRQLYDDPSSIADTPGYRFALSQGSENLARTLGSRGLAHSGKMSTDMMEFAQGLASQTFDREAQRLAGLAGAQFGPETAARLRMQGLDSSVRARNGALAALMFPFGNNQGGGPQGNGLDWFSQLFGNSLGQMPNLNVGGPPLQHLPNPTDIFGTPGQGLLPNPFAPEEYNSASGATYGGNL